MPIQILETGEVVVGTVVGTALVGAVTVVVGLEVCGARLATGAPVGGSVETACPSTKHAVANSTRTSIRILFIEIITRSCWVK